MKYEHIKILFFLTPHIKNLIFVFELAAYLAHTYFFTFPFLGVELL